MHESSWVSAEGTKAQFSIDDTDDVADINLSDYNITNGVTRQNPYKNITHFSYIDIKKSYN